MFTSLPVVKREVTAREGKKFVLKIHYLKKKSIFSNKVCECSTSAPFLGNQWPNTSSSFSETESGCFCRWAINYYGTLGEILTHAAAPDFKKSSIKLTGNTPELVALQFN